ncbi:hypothetical protein F5Y09DRAFT_323706 [Xylaria sp. FL1042]|nr:hypothetical protein F5Y09DRAFT_323706 [Xylaria sp. FL1042]
MAMSADSVSTQYPQLYTELYLLIIEFSTDSRYLPQVWLNFRRVSHQFKELTESVFVQKHLPHTIIIFPNITGSVYDVNDTRHQLSLALEFKKLTGDNDERAVFSENRYYYNASTETRITESGSITLATEVTDLWRRYFHDYSMPAPNTAFSTSPHIISVRRVANDTALPGLEVNWEEHTITVLWKDMLTALFSEEEYIGRLAEKDIREGRENAPPMQDSVEALEDLIETGDNEAIYEFMKSFAWNAKKMDNERRQMVRRERFRRWYKNYTSLTTEEADEQPRDTNKVKVIQDYRETLNWTEFEDEWSYERSEYLLI